MNMTTRDTSCLVERLVPRLNAPPATGGASLGSYNLATASPRRVWFCYQATPSAPATVALAMHQANNSLDAGGVAVDVAAAWQSINAAALSSMTVTNGAVSLSALASVGNLVILEVAYDDVDIAGGLTWLHLVSDMGASGLEALLIIADIPTDDATYYATRAQFKAFVGNIADVVDDSTIDLCLGAASRAIDGHCGRRFWKATETRYFTPRDSEALMIPDLVSITTLKTDDDLDDVHEITWATTDYVLRPRNAPYASPARPYNEIKVTRAGRYRFIRGADSVEITGMWGWQTLPTEITLACLEQAHRFFARRGSPFGVIGTPDVGTLALLSAKLDPDVAVKLEPFVSSVGSL